MSNVGLSHPKIHQRRILFLGQANSFEKGMIIIHCYPMGYQSLIVLHITYPVQYMNISFHVSNYWYFHYFHIHYLILPNATPTYSDMV